MATFILSWLATGILVLIIAVEEFHNGKWDKRLTLGYILVVLGGLISGVLMLVDLTKKLMKSYK